MNGIANLALIFVVIVIVGYLIARAIKKNKNEVVENAEVDDKTFTLDKMVKFVKQRLDEITKMVRFELAQKIDQKYVPEIRFVYDDTLERASRIEELLNNLEV